MKNLSIIFLLALFWLGFMVNLAIAADWYEMESGTTNTLHGVWGSSATDVFAVGNYGTILHYNGSTWSPMSSGTTNTLHGVWGSSATDVFAVGNYGTILHYNGIIWSSMNNISDRVNFEGIWGSSGLDVFAVGSGEFLEQIGFVFHYNGSNWSDITSGTNDELHSVWGSTGSDVFAVGDGGIFHYDGLNWSEISQYGILRDIWGSSGTDVFAVGSYGTILHYEGSSWEEMPSGTNALLKGIWGSSGTDVFAVGGGFWPNGIIIHYNGDSWSGGTTFTTSSCCSFNSTPGMVTEGEINDIWGSSSADVFAVGDGGLVLHYDGTSSKTSTSTSSTTTTICYCPPLCIYGEESEEVELLRYFRDDVLSQTPEGQAIINLYYQLSPMVVEAMQADKDFEKDVKEMIDGVLELIGEDVE